MRRGRNQAIGGTIEAFRGTDARGCDRIHPLSAMALLPNLEFPDPRLRTKAAPVDPAWVPGEEAQRLFDVMFETMYEAPGIDLARTPVDEYRRFMVFDVRAALSQPLVFMKPEIIDRSGEQVCQEGCLSVPGIYADVTRAGAITVKALDRTGAAFEMQAEGLLAV